MSMSELNDIEIKKQLEERFLYQEDVDALDLLLSILDNNKSYYRMKPKYICSSRIRRSLLRLLHYREDRELIISSILKSIHDDINRLELSMYIDSYTKGYDYKEAVDCVETFALKQYSATFLNNRKSLYHSSKDRRVQKLKKEVLSKYQEKNPDLHMNRFIEEYCDRTIKEKIMKVNTTMNKQLRFYYDKNNLYINEEIFLSKRLLGKIYRKILLSFTRVMSGIMKNALWYGINDRVLDRYR